MFKNINVKKAKQYLLLSTVIFGISLITGCGGGGGDDGNGSENPTRVVTGAVSEGAALNLASEARLGPAGTFTVTAVKRDGSIHETDTDPVTREFELELPVEECYIMSVTAHTGENMMDIFWDYLVFDCGPDDIGEFNDQFCLSDGDNPVDLGIITAYSDHRFATPMRNPIEQVDFDGDGIMDFDDPDYVCGNVEDDNHDGYFDDDMDHDGFHDDDMNFDGFHDDDMDRDGFHDGGNDGGDMDGDGPGHDD